MSDRFDILIKARRDRREQAIRAGHGRPEILGINNLIGLGVGAPAAVPIEFVVSAAGTPCVVSKPAEVQAGDLLIFVGACSNAATGPADTTEQVAYTTANPKLYVWTKIATGSEPATYTITDAGGNSLSLSVYRNVSQSAPVNAIGTIAHATATSSATNSVTSTVHGCVIASIYGLSQPGVAITADAATVARMSQNDGTNYPSLLADETQAAAGSSSARTATWSGSRTYSNIAIAIAPA